MGQARRDDQPQTHPSVPFHEEGTKTDTANEWTRTLTTHKRIHTHALPNHKGVNTHTRSRLLCEGVQHPGNTSQSRQVQHIHAPRRPDHKSLLTNKDRKIERYIDRNTRQEKETNQSRKGDAGGGFFCCALPDLVPLVAPETPQDPERFAIVEA